MLRWRTSLFDKVVTVPTASIKKHDTSAPMEIGMAAKEDGENACQEGDQRIMDIALCRLVYKGTGKEKWGFGKGQNWDEKGGKGGTDGVKEPPGRKAAARKEVMGKRKAAREKPERVGRAARQGHIAAWYRKGGNKNLYVTWTKMTARTPRSQLRMKRICRHGVYWKRVRHEQWKEVISRRSKQRAKKVNQASLLSVESSHSLSPKKIVEVKDKWVQVRTTTDSGAAGHARRCSHKSNLSAKHHRISLWQQMV